MRWVWQKWRCGDGGGGGYGYDGDVYMRAHSCARRIEQRTKPTTTECAVYFMQNERIECGQRIQCWIMTTTSTSSSTTATGTKSTTLKILCTQTHARKNSTKCEHFIQKAKNAWAKIMYRKRWKEIDEIVAERGAKRNRVRFFLFF